MAHTTLELMRLADQALAIGIERIADARKLELDAARAFPHRKLSRNEDNEHARHLLCNSALTRALCLVTKAREILS